MRCVLPVQDAKYGPLSQQILTHEAFRAAGERLKAACAGLAASAKAGTASGPALANFALQVRLVWLNEWLGLAVDRQAQHSSCLVPSCLTSRRDHVRPPTTAAAQFRRYRLAHAWHAHQEESVIFKEFEAYCPG